MRKPDSRIYKKRMRICREMKKEGATVNQMAEKLGIRSGTLRLWLGSNREEYEREKKIARGIKVVKLS